MRARLTEECRPTGGCKWSAHSVGRAQAKKALQEEKLKIAFD